MNLSENFLGMAEHHHNDGSITDTFAKMAGQDMGLGARADLTTSIDTGFDFSAPGGMS